MNHGVVLELLRCVKNASAIVGPNNRKLSILKKRTPEWFYIYRTLKPPWANASLSQPNQPTDLPQIWNSIQNVKNIQISLNNLLKKCNFCTDFIQICDFSLKSPFFQTLQSIWTSCLGCSGCHFCHSCHLFSSPFSLLFWSGELEMSKSWILSFLKK